MNVIRTGDRLSVDIHGMRCEEAKERLLWLLGHQCKGINEVTVIHGYHSGRVLQDMVRKLKHPRIERKLLSMNQGETVLVLTKSDYSYFKKSASK